MLSISLSVSRDPRFAPVPGHTSVADRGSQRLRSATISQPRHMRRCAYCDFAFGSSECFEVSHLDGDHTNNSVENTVLACELCHAPLHLDLVARRWRSHPGTIIYLPELTQPQLNNLLQAIFFAKSAQQGRQEEQGDSAASSELIKVHSLFIELQRRASLVEQLPDGSTGRPGMSQPSTLARILSEMSDDEYEQRDKLLHGLRYLPSEAVMIEAAKGWGEHGAAFSRLDVAAWAAIAGLAA